MQSQINLQALPIRQCVTPSQRPATQPAPRHRRRVVGAAGACVCRWRSALGVQVGGKRSTCYRAHRYLDQTVVPLLLQALSALVKERCAFRRRCIAAVSKADALFFLAPCHTLVSKNSSQYTSDSHSKLAW